MTWVLGICAAAHDSAAALTKDGQLIAAVEEERFNRRKHAKLTGPFTTHELPYLAIAACLGTAGIDLSEIDHVGYSWDPALLPEPLSMDLTNAEWVNTDIPEHPLFRRSLESAPDFMRSLVPYVVPHWLRSILLPDSAEVHWQWHFLEHHLCHAASAAFMVDAPSCAFLTLDGAGERESSTWGVVVGDEIHILGSTMLPHSLGLLYEDVCAHLGFPEFGDEGKVMALAAYGDPAYRDVFDRYVFPVGGGSFRTLRGGLLEELADIAPRRHPGMPIRPVHQDIASSLQAALEATATTVAGDVREATKQDTLCIAGGVALNCAMNSKIQQGSGFRHVAIQPAAGDAGTALGAALLADRSAFHARRTTPMATAYLGTEYSDEYIRGLLDGAGLRYESPEDLVTTVVRMLVEDQVVAWFQGRMEYGPRALGARSLLASPVSLGMRDRLNRVKGREAFRPVAPVVLEEQARNFFDGITVSPFMLLTYAVRSEHADRIPAVCHVDGTSRVQTLNRQQNSLLYDVIAGFAEATGIPMLVNTSLNVRGRPIVEAPEEALEAFITTPIDALVLGHNVVRKS